MPISIDDFSAGRLPDGPSVPEQVVSFLAANDDKAFTRSEIAAGIDADPNAVGTALSRLKERELVRHRGNYWAITEDRERLQSAYQLHRAGTVLDEQDGGIDPEEWDEHAPDEPHPSEQE
ncbi:MAG: MarR family transcriptional regulator [Halalkalicoccus sp.]